MPARPWCLSLQSGVLGIHVARGGFGVQLGLQRGILGVHVAGEGLGGQRRINDAQNIVALALGPDLQLVSPNLT